MRVRVGLVVLLVALTVAAGTSAAPTSYMVLGFQSDYAPARLIGENAKAMSLVGVDGVDLSGAGIVDAPAQADKRQLAAAHAHGLPAVLLVANWSNKVNDFSESLAHQTLGDPQHIDGAASMLANAVIQGGWDGVSVDLEALAPRDKSGLSRFVADLKADLPGNDSLSVCISANTTLAGYAAEGYDLAALAASADQIVLMTYDDHGPWEKTPGPIGPLHWQQVAVSALERRVPPGEILLGVANYAYAWRPHSVDSLTVAQARRLAARWHAKPRWIASASEWRARLGDGSTLWWSDKRSMRIRLRLAINLYLRGIAVWSLGTGDRLP